MHGLAGVLLLLAIDELWNDYAPFARMYMIVVSYECMRRAVPPILSIKQGDGEHCKRNSPSYEEMPLEF
jgi:hypothetical protein